MSSPLPTAHRSPLTAHFPGLATLILILAAVLRLVALSDVPPGLAQDEVLDAGIALMVRQGQHALFFREGFGHEPLYHYLAAPFGGLLGENVLSIRLPSVFLGLLLIALTMRWARREFGGLVAAVAGAALAVSWWPIIFSRIGIRPILEPVLLLLAAYFWPRRPWLAGVFLGLTIYTYTPARLLFLIPVLFLVYLLLRQNLLPIPYSQNKEPQHTIRNTQYAIRNTQYAISNLQILLIALLLTLPLYLTLRADPTLQQRVEQLSGPLEALRQGDVRPVFQATAATLGLFSFTGDPRWTYTLPGRPLYDPLTSLLFYGGVVLALWRFRRPEYAFALIWLAVGLLPSALTPDAPSTVRLVGAMPVVYVLLGIGARGILDFGFWILDWSAKSKIQNLKSKIAWLLLLPLLVLNLGRTVRDGFGRWPAEVETRLRYQSVLLDVSHLWPSPVTTKVTTGVIADSFYEPIDHFSLQRTAGQDLDERWVQGGGAIILPAGGGRLYVPEFAPLDAALSQAAGLSSTPLRQSTERPVVAVYALPKAFPQPAVPLAATFDEALTLFGYQILPHQAGEALRLLTYWRVEADNLPWDLAIFVHLLDSGGTLLAQSDGLDAAAATLRPGDVFIQLHSLPLPEEQPAGPYTLQLGLYVRGDGRRLTHPGDPADRLILDQNFAIDGR